MVSEIFNPHIYQSYYFIRKGLYTGIVKYKSFMKGKLMDFGCGEKPYRSLFSVEEYVGVDYDGEGHGHTGESIDIFYDGKTIPIPDNTFDSVFSSEVFEHIFNIEEILPEINRVMKPGAHILLTCPFVWNLHEIPVDYARYTPYALMHLLEKNGFEIVEIHKCGNFISTLTQMRVLYVSLHLLPKLRLNRIKYLTSAVVAVMNMIGLIKLAILPNKDDFYQSNVVLARKKDGKIDS